MKVVDPESNRPELDVMPEWAAEPFLDNIRAGFVYTKCFYLMFIQMALLDCIMCKIKSFNKMFLHII